MRLVGMILGVVTACAAFYEYTAIRRSRRSGGSAIVPRHLSIAPRWARWLSRYEASFRACSLLFIGLLVAAGSLAPSARGFNASRAGAGTLAILITAMIALCGMFVCIVAKWAAARLQRPDSKLTSIVVR